MDRGLAILLWSKARFRPIRSPLLPGPDRHEVTPELSRGWGPWISRPGREGMCVCRVRGWQKAEKPWQLLPGSGVVEQGGDSALRTAPRSGYEEGRAAESLFTDSGSGLGVWAKRRVRPSPRLYTSTWGS